MTTRRTLLAGGLAAATHVSLSPNHAARAAAPQPALDIIDCHTHFYDPTRPEGIPWPPKGSPLYRTVLPKHLRAEPQSQPVTGTVIVEASSRLEDNQWLLDLARDDPFVVGIVGSLDPSQPDYPKHLKRFARNRLFRGIRVGDRVVTKLLAAGKSDAFALLGTYDLELDVIGGPTSPQVVAQLAQRLPDLRIVINHIANVPIDKNPPPAKWVQAMGAAARHANVYCKVSALVSAAAQDGRKAPTDLDFYRPYLNVVFTAFGEDRVIYGSDWPVSAEAADYRTQQKLALDYVAERGRAATRKFCSLNARTAYKWVDRKGRRRS